MTAAIKRRAANQNNKNKRSMKSTYKLKYKV